MSEPASTAAAVLPYKISVLVFIQNQRDEFLLLHRAKSPNQGCWSPLGGKLEMATGESPFECAAREVREEIGAVLSPEDLHLFALIAEKAYEGQTHWLMFLFHCRRRISALPPPFDEGEFGFFSREAIDRLAVPETDKKALWPIFDRHREGFVCLRADCDPARPVEVVVEQVMDRPAARSI